MKTNKLLDDVKLLELASVKISVVTPIRVPKETAKAWLLENKSIVRGGNVHYLAIMDMGLGVCMVKLRPADKVNTFVVKEWEVHSIPSEFKNGLGLPTQMR